MPSCDICTIIKSQELKLFEDPYTVVFLHPQGSAPGHVLIVPRIHYPIMEQIPDDDLRQIFRVTRIISGALEKGIGCKDINLVIANGTAAGQEFPHFSIQLIPRGSGDGVSIGWDPMTIAKNDMDSIEKKLQDMCKQFTVLQKQAEHSPQEEVVSRDDQQIRRMTRIP